jgi:hypothetical protein
MICQIFLFFEIMPRITIFIAVMFSTFTFSQDKKPASSGFEQQYPMADL